jgi:hypothetical protein
MMHSFHMCLVVLLAGGVLAACGHDDTAAADPTGAGGGGGNGALPPEAAALSECPPDTGVEPPHTDTSGIYSVPVPPDLEPFSHYAIDSVTACRRGTRVELGYKLPALLVGKPVRVGFSGTYDDAAGAFVLTGDGTANCQVTDGSWSCFEEFAGISVDLEAVVDETVGLSPDEAAGRLDVAEAFSVDPIGILDFVAAAN